jgi:hypothetical protein
MGSRRRDWAAGLAIGVVLLTLLSGMPTCSARRDWTVSAFPDPTKAGAMCGAHVRSQHDKSFLCDPDGYLTEGAAVR